MFEKKKSLTQMVLKKKRNLPVTHSGHVELNTKKCSSSFSS